MSLLQRFFLARGGERIASIILRAFGGTTAAPGGIQLDWSDGTGWSDGLHWSDNESPGVFAIPVHAGTTASPGAVIQIRPGTS